MVDGETGAPQGVPDSFCERWVILDEQDAHVVFFFRFRAAGPVSGDNSGSGIDTNRERLNGAVKTPVAGQYR